jgi:UDP-glucose 4-epimerase
VTDANGQRCLVVGGGLIGAHTVAELIGRDHAVTVYSRSFSEALTTQAARDPAIDLVQGSLPEGESLDELVRLADIVFLLAGSSTPALSDVDAVSSITGSLEPGLSVLESIRRCSKRRVVVASSGGTVYGRAQTIPTPEDAPLEPISLHGVTSVAFESYVSYYTRQLGLEPIVLRYSNVYGPGQRARHGQGVIAAWCASLSRGEPITLIGSSEVRRDFIYASDAARATLDAAFAAKRPAVYNVGSGTSHSLAEVLSLLEAVSGMRPEIAQRDARAIDVPTTELDCTRLTEQTGWRAKVGLAEGLASTWRST